MDGMAGMAGMGWDGTGWMDEEGMYGWFGVCVCIYIHTLLHVEYRY